MLALSLIMYEKTVMKKVEEGKLMVWSTTQIAQWQRIEQRYQADTSATSSRKDLCQNRTFVQQEMSQVLNAFLNGAMTLRDFNSVFQHKTHEAWNVFHLRGMSGGLFLNKLIKYIPCEEAFAHLLRMILRVPVNAHYAQKNMQVFIQFLEEIIASGQATRLQIQPARVPFFLSAWWHIQEAEQWPLFYLEVRRVLIPEDKELKSSQDAVGAYFRFRQHFLSWTHVLGMHSWELEHFIRWYLQQDSDKAAGEEMKSSELTIEEDMSSTNERGGTINERTIVSYKKRRDTHSYIYLQWLLAKIGLKVGCSVWIAKNAHEKVWNGERLGDLSLSSAPLLIDSTCQRILDQADVLWLYKNDVIAVYEIERSIANIATSLLSLYDFGTLFPKREMHLYMVAPKVCFERIQFELSRPVFQRQDMSKRCRIIPEEHLIQQAEHILRWATSPAVLEDLSAYLSN